VLAGLADAPLINGTEGSAKGGGVYCVGKQTLLLADTGLVDNVAAGSGGGLFAIFCTPVFVSTSVQVRRERGWPRQRSDEVRAQGNVADTGGGLSATETSQVVLLGSTVGNNYARLSGAPAPA
jgi:hypothetical protein